VSVERRRRVLSLLLVVLLAVATTLVTAPAMHEIVSPPGGVVFIPRLNGALTVMTWYDRRGFSRIELRLLGGPRTGWTSDRIIGEYAGQSLPPGAPADFPDWLPWDVMREAHADAVVASAVGWPARSLTVHRSLPAAQAGAISSAALRFTSVTNWRNGGVRVRWRGFIANTATFGALWALVLVVPREARVRLRKRRGHCPECGYDLLHDFKSGCPECGWNRDASMANDPP